jgi:HSP20 family protein
MNNSLTNWDPFREELDDMQQRMSRLFGQALRGSHWLTPTTDVYEENGKLVMETALPNFRDDEVQVEVNQNRLEIKAERRQEEERKGRNYLRRESSQASYYRQFALPEDVEADSAEAKFEHGVLTISFDRKELPQPKRLKLKSGQGDSKK